MNTQWNVIIGLEIHAQINTKSKLFSSAPTKFGEAPNTEVVNIDVALPGTLPRLNGQAIKKAIKAGLALGGRVNQFAYFDRKHYFYPDLPKGYQISQLRKPLIEGGKIEIYNAENKLKTIRINRLHVEEDAGKSLHDQNPKETYIDLNRAGVPLMEIVSEADITTADEAAMYVRKLRTLLMSLEVNNGNMAEGALRIDLNLSVHKTGEPWGQRTEMKNINSIRGMQRAIEYESHRQIQVLKTGGSIIQETRHFNLQTGETIAMRSKENVGDYRYFPDPNLLPIITTDEELIVIKNTLPELPEVKARRFVNTYGLSGQEADFITLDNALADYFEQAVKGGNAQKVYNWITGDLFGYLNRNELIITESPISPDQLSELVALIQSGKISGKMGKKVFEIMIRTQTPPQTIVEEMGGEQISDTAMLQKIIQTIIQENPEQVKKYTQNPKLLGWFVGQAIKATKGKGNPTLLNLLMKKVLEENK